MIPSVTHPRWGELVPRPDPFGLEWLPLRILLSRIKIGLFREPSEARIRRSGAFTSPRSEATQ
jgi:hypothetical protein